MRSTCAASDRTDESGVSIRKTSGQISIMSAPVAAIKHTPIAVQIFPYRFACFASPAPTLLPTSVVAADPFTPGRFLCAGNGILLESRDGGKSFDNNWLVTGTIHAIAFDPETPGLLAILLADRILLSRDGGKHFAVLSIDGVPITTGTRIVLDRKRLFAATWGSGVFYRSVE